MALVSKNFSDIITFTRASTATYFDSTGTLQTAAINAARLDYDPSTLAAQGLLIEESRTNSIRNNTMVGAVAGTPGTQPTNWGAWTTAVSGVTASITGVGTDNGIAYIDWNLSGTYTGTTGTAFTPSFESATQIAASVGQTWSESVYLKLQAGSIGTASFSLRMTEADGAGASLTSGDSSAITPTGAALNASRITFTRTTTNAGIVYIYPRIRVGLTNGETYNFTLRIGLPQLELGAFATSVIPTTTTALTRAADVASVNTLSPWFNSSTGTLYSEFVFEGLKSAAGQAITTFDDGTANNRIAQLATAANAMQNAVVVAGAIDGNNTTPATTYAANSTYKNAYAYAVNDFVTAVNGTTGTVDTTLPALPSGLSNFKIGASTANTSNLWLRRITYYPRRLSNAELQAITA